MAAARASDGEPLFVPLGRFSSRWRKKLVNLLDHRGGQDDLDRQCFLTLNNVRSVHLPSLASILPS